MITGSELLRGEIERVWDIDRSEVIDKVYYLENGTLVLRLNITMSRGWPPGEAERYTPIPLDCFDRGGWFHGAFNDAKLVGVVCVGLQAYRQAQGSTSTQVLHIGSAYRNRGLGKRLFDLARAVARERGARQLYISATPSENTVNFYLRLCCQVAEGALDQSCSPLNPKTSTLYALRDV